MLARGGIGEKLSGIYDLKGIWRSLVMDQFLWLRDYTEFISENEVIGETVC